MKTILQINNISAKVNGSFDGLYIDVVLTKDNIPLIYNRFTTNLSIEAIYSHNFNQIKSPSTITLEQALNYYRSFNKLIILNIIIPTIFLTYQEMNDYTNSITKIVNSYHMMDIYISSPNHTFLINIKPKTQNKLGLFVHKDDLGYVDVDYYIFPPDMLDVNIFKEQYKIGKQTMIVVFNEQSLDTIKKFLDINKEKLTTSLINSLFLIYY